MRADEASPRIEWRPLMLEVHGDSMTMRIAAQRGPEDDLATIFHRGRRQYPGNACGAGATARPDLPARLAGDERPTEEVYNVAFMKRLAERGFVEGRNLVVEYRSMRGQSERVPQLAAELAQLNCDVYFAPGSELTLAAIT